MSQGHDTHGKENKKEEEVIEILRGDVENYLQAETDLSLFLPYP
jgi:hypothetical protein